MAVCSFGAVDRREIAEFCLRLGAASVLACAVSGCAASIQGAPERLFPVAAEADQLRLVSGPDWYARYAQALGPSKRDIRNQIVFSRIYAIDLAYSQYELKLTREQQSVGFLGTLTQLGITTTGTFVGGEQTKTILHAAATGVTGVKEGYEKNILIERTIAILQQQMRAQRQLVKAKIVERVALGTDAYPLEFALSDVEEYYRAGTLTGALIGASNDAGTTLQEANEEEHEVLTYRFSQTEYLPRLQKFYRSSPVNREMMRQWLRDQQVDLEIVPFMAQGSTQEHAAMIRDLGIP